MVLRCLVVDDEPFVRTTLSLLLRLEGHDVTTAADGQAGLQAALAQLPDVILSDLHMPGMDGQALLAAVRADKRLVRTRIVLLTGDTQLAPALAGAPDAVLIKPFTREQLHQALDALQRDRY